MDVPSEVDLSDSLGARILVIGDFYQDINTMKIKNVENMEILPEEKVPVPTETPSSSTNSAEVE